MRALADLAPIGLEELDRTAALQVRIERKYLLSVKQAALLVGRLAESHRGLEIEGRRTFAYRTTYFDTPELLTYRDHLQRRRQRFKCRRRLYEDSGLSRLELKLRGPGGMTVKHALPSLGGDGLDPDERVFLLERLAGEHEGRIDAGRLTPTLTVLAQRATLAAPGAGERVTLDLAVGFAGWRLDPGKVIVETKSRLGRGEADGVLRELGLRPQRVSKYCAGMTLSGQGRRANRFLVFTRSFEPV